jgi:hypothetical protein
MKSVRGEIATGSSPRQSRLWRKPGTRSLPLPVLTSFLRLLHFQSLQNVIGAATRRLSNYELRSSEHQRWICPQENHA